MMHSEYKYVGYKRQLIAKTAIVDIDSIEVDDKTEHYQSIYRFDDSVSSYKSLSDIKPNIKFFADYLIFDIDADILSEAYDSLQKLVGYLDLREVGYETWFSGSKGFHVQLPTSQFNFEPTNQSGILKSMAEAIAEKVGIVIDTKIYNTTRILRMPGSLNSKTGLFKVPVAPYSTLESMLEDAKAPLPDCYPESDDYGINDTLKALYNGATQESVVRINRTILPSEDPKETRLFLPASSGNRNDALYKLARKLARRSVGEQDALWVCGKWATDLPEPMTEREIKKTVLSAYTKGMNELVDEENFKDHFFDAKKSLSGVRRIISNLNKNVVKTGFDFIDDYTMGLFKGDVVFIIARPGNFKTCILSSLLKSISLKTKGKTLMFSMEMSPERLSMRHIQAAEGMGQMEAIEAIKKGHPFDKYIRDFGDVVVIGLSSLSIDMIIGLIDYYLEEYGEISAIGFDYLSLFKGAANNTEATARIATELKTRVAKAANAVTFCLVQARRKYEGKGGNVEIDRQAGKDSSSIEDSGDYVIGAWNHEGVHYGKWLKSRAFNGTKYNENPYMQISINKPHMKLEAVSYLDDFEVPKFEQPRYGVGE